MQSGFALFPKVTVGLDLGDRTSRVCEVDARARVVKQATVATTPGGLDQYFGGRPRCRVVLEAATHSPWVSRQLEGLGHEVVVSNPSEVYGRRRRKKRNDRTDAEFLARQGRADVELLHPIRHRSAEAQMHLEMIRARDQLVRARTKLVNHVRGAVKAAGYRVGRCSAEAFARKARTQIPQDMEAALSPLLEVIADLTRHIAGYDRQIEQVVLEHHPEAARLQQIKGRGTVDGAGLRAAGGGPATLPKEQGRRRILRTGPAAGRKQRCAAAAANLQGGR